MREFEYQEYIMGGNVSISLVVGDRAVADAVAARMFARARAADAQFSRFRPESELSLLNQERSRTVSPRFMELFLLGRELHRRSAGIFNPLVDISRFGYDADVRDVKGKDRTGTNPTIPYDIDLDAVEVESSGRITLTEGQRLDFGGFLKGHVAEEMAKEAEELSGVIVNLGGDIFTRGTDADGEPFVFAIDHPHDPDADIRFTLRDAAIATSGSYNRYWKYRGKPFFHILDRSGKHNPQTDLISATVIAPRGCDADAFATVAFILGSREGARVLDANGFHYYFIRKDGSTLRSSAFPLVCAPAFAYVD